jgi:hypothetical protein
VPRGETAPTTARNHADNSGKWERHPAKRQGAAPAYVGPSGKNTTTPRNCSAARLSLTQVRNNCPADRPTLAATPHPGPHPNPGSSPEAWTSRRRLAAAAARGLSSSRTLAAEPHLQPSPAEPAAGCTFCTVALYARCRSAPCEPTPTLAPAGFYIKQGHYRAAVRWLLAR